MLQERASASAPARCSWPDGALSKASTPTSLSSGFGDDDTDDWRGPEPIDPVKLSLYVHWANGCGCAQGVHFAPPNVEYRNSADMQLVNHIRSLYNPWPARFDSVLTVDADVDADADYEFDRCQCMLAQRDWPPNDQPHGSTRIRLCLLALLGLASCCSVPRVKQTPRATEQPNVCSSQGAARRRLGQLAAALARTPRGAHKPLLSQARPRTNSAPDRTISI